MALEAMLCRAGIPTDISIMCGMSGQRTAQKAPHPDHMEVIAVTMTKRMTQLAVIAGFTIAAMAPQAMAQKTTAPAAQTTPAPAAAAKTAKVPSPCKGLVEDACKNMGETCSWVAATKRKDGKTIKAYCRKKAGFAAKKKDAPAKAATPAKPA